MNNAPRRTLASLGVTAVLLAAWCATCGDFSGGDSTPGSDLTPREVGAASPAAPAAPRPSAQPVPLKAVGSAPLVVTPVAFAGDSESAEGVKPATFDDIKFEMKKEEKFKQRMLTDKINDLFGKSIRIRGYILPSFKQTGLTQFVLVRDNMECCFGPGAAIYDCIIVEMVEGHTAAFSVRPVTVEGKFSFQKLEDPVDGALRAIYHLDGVSVK